VISSNNDVVDNAQRIIVALKPHYINSVLSQVKERLDDQLVISLAAKTKIEDLENILGKESRIARVMPIMSYRAGHGQADYFFNGKCDDQDKNMVQELFNYGGKGKEVTSEKSLEDTTIDACKIGWLAHEFDLWQQLREDPNDERFMEIVKSVMGLHQQGYSFNDITQMVGKDRKSITGKGRTIARGIKKVYEKMIDLLK
jgi:hypothetical protein